MSIYKKFRKATWSIFQSVGLPLIIVASYLLVSRTLYIGGVVSDLVVLVISLSAGAYYLSRVKLVKHTLIPLIALYIVVGSVLIVFFSLFFVCAIFKDCL